MTETMEMMYEDIKTSLYYCFPKEYVDFCLEEDYPLNVVQYVKYVLLEFVKNAYDESMEKHSLRYYFPDFYADDDHGERMRYARIMDYSQKFRDKNYNILIKYFADNPKKLEKFEELKRKNMSVMANRIEGHELTEMQVFEQTTMLELQIIKSIVEGRISSSKKVSNAKFVEMYQEYDNWVEKLIQRADNSDEDLVFSSLAFFTLEWKYSLEFIYLVSEYMESEKIEEVEYDTFWAMALPMHFISGLGMEISVDNRMIKERQELVFDFFNPDADPFGVYRSRYVELLGITCCFLEMPSTEKGLSYLDWFRENTCLKDWASFMREYRMFSAWHRKEWTNQRIKNARKLLKWVQPFREEKEKK